MKKERPDIFSYTDHQTFLRDWLNYKKSSQSRFSMRELARLAGLASGYLPMVMSGKRPLTESALTKISPHLGLSSAEQSYLSNLVKLGATHSNDVHVSVLDKMNRFQQFQKQNPKEAEAYQYLTKWYHVAIREMATLPDFKADPLWVQQRLQYAVPLNEIRNAIEFLIEKEFLRLKPDGSVEPPLKTIECDDDVYRVALTKFHREILKLAAQSIEKTPKSQRKIMGHTCSLSPENYRKAENIVQEAIAKIRELGQTDSAPDSVYHLELALFPLSLKPEDENE